MANKTIIGGLRHKRARLAGEIEAQAQRLAKDREALAALNATLRLFHPDADPEAIVTIRPSLRCVKSNYVYSGKLPAKLYADYIWDSLNGKRPRPEDFKF
jgi:hypothetical protein